jgi:two-component system, NarL family, sensor kinase
MIYLTLTITFILMLLVCFILGILFIHQKKQMAYFEAIEKLKHDHERNILKTQLEITEQTFQHISREIHDNISLSLTLAKLTLNTMDWLTPDLAKNQVSASSDQITKALNDLTDISKSLSSDLINNHGLIQTLSSEIRKIDGLGLFKLIYDVRGETVFMDSQKELVIFRIIQEAFNNIIKHANATCVKLNLSYRSGHVALSISDNGDGFNLSESTIPRKNSLKAGLNNMKKRAEIFNGEFSVKSQLKKGTTIFVTIPYN